MYDIYPTIPEYAAHKIKMLTKEFCLKLTADEKAHMKSLETTVQIDRYARSLIMERL